LKSNNNVSRKGNNSLITSNAAKKSPKAQTISSIVQSNLRTKGSHKRTSNANSTAGLKETQSATPVNLTTLGSQMDRGGLQSARPPNTKKFKSISESNPSGSQLKSQKLKQMMKQGHANQQSIFDQDPQNSKTPVQR